MRDPAAARQSEVIIDGESCNVWTAKTGARWRAWGRFRGQSIEVRDGDSESGAIRKWTYLANSVANE